MRLSRRIAVLCLTGAVAAGGYALARRYSTEIIAYVVEQTLLQKAPPDVDRGELAQRFERRLASAPGRADRLQYLMEVAARLEKVQQLDSEDLMRLLDRPGF